MPPQLVAPVGLLDGHGSLSGPLQTPVLGPEGPAYLLVDLGLHVRGEDSDLLRLGVELPVEEGHPADPVPPLPVARGHDGGEPFDLGPPLDLGGGPLPLEDVDVRGTELVVPRRDLWILLG